jgi:protein translocase SecG subunit
MSWIVGILSVFLVLACLLLMLLVLIQLPKKEAGMGQAFGGGATDALFGAGSGTALTKMTKYTTVIFFVLTLLLWVLKAQEVRRRPDLEKNMQLLGKTMPAVPGTPSTATAPKTTTTPGTNSLLLSNSAFLTSTTTNPPSKATNSPPKAETTKPQAESPK